ncbi:MAG: diaminopimelate epimerase [Blastocatellia bacterium]|jgi:diaminopimelate epimerase|nr:diaminopimelate epimerase [Blastocatellia bacterium]
MAINFTKFQGFGNDYIVFEAEQLSAIDDLNEFARAVCNRHYGAGADGIDVVSPSQDPGADFVVRIFNVDGSEANLSGNGTRCAAAFLFYHERWSREELRLQTGAGVKRYRLLERLGTGGFLFESELGQPKFDSASVPMLTSGPLERIIDYPLDVAGEIYPVTALQMGNPNCCVFVDDFEALDWRRIGRAIEIHPLFPDRTNVIFVRVRDRGNIEERIWERGVGETESSGTCSCAAVVASVINDKTDRSVNVHAPGGLIPIEWREDGEVVLTGRADVVYSGRWLR